MQRQPPPPFVVPHPIPPSHRPPFLTSPSRSADGRVDIFPSSQQTFSSSQRPSQGYPPVSVSPQRMESYRSDRPMTGPVSAHDVFVQNRGKTGVTASDKILMAVRELGGQISSIQGEVLTLKSETRTLRDQLHELHQGQKAIPTRDQVAEEVMNHVTPAIQAALRSNAQEISSYIRPTARSVVDTVIPQVKALLEDRDRALRSAKEQDDMSQQPLSTLLTHLIDKLNAVETIGDSLPSIRSISQAVGDITLCKESLVRVRSLTEKSFASSPTLEDFRRQHETLSSLQHSVQDLQFKCDKSSNTFRMSDLLELGGKYQGHTLATNSKLTMIHNTLKALLSNQKQLLSQSESQDNSLLDRSTFPSSQEASQPHIVTPISRGTNIERMAPPTPGLTSNIRATRSACVQVHSTLSSSTQNSSLGDRPLVGNSVVDIFGPKSYIPGPVRLPSGEAILEESSQAGSENQDVEELENDEGRPFGIPDSPLIAASKRPHKRTKATKKKPITTMTAADGPRSMSIDSHSMVHASSAFNSSFPGTALSESQTAHRETRSRTRQSSQYTSQLQASFHTDIGPNSSQRRGHSRAASHISNTQPTSEPDHEHQRLDATLSGNHQVNTPGLSSSSRASKRIEGGSKGKKRTWDFSDDEEEDDS